MPTAAYYTFGCKVNQYETEKIRLEMESRGFDTVRFNAPADVYVINTCTVTSVADGKSRHAIRQANRRNPDSVVVVTGCYAELEPQAILTIPGVDLVFPNAEKSEIADRLRARFPDFPARARPAQELVQQQRTRAVIKVQDGCDHFCAYCIVPFARPRKCSRPIDDVLREAEALASHGYKEVVLTGIRLGSYSDSSADTADLAREIADIDGIARVRLSSIEPWEATDKLIAVMASSPKICPHLHIPLQSGADTVLSRMGRPYDASAYGELILKLREAVPGIAITTDILVGFPGETDDEFERCRAFVEEIGFSRLHVFRYSPRRGTRAESMDNHIPERVKERRSRTMIELGARLAHDFAKSRVGRTVSVLAEGKRTASGRLSGFTPDYIETEFEASGSDSGRIVEVIAAEAVGARLIGAKAAGRTAAL